MKFQKLFKQTYAALDPRWNARVGYRPIDDTCVEIANPLPAPALEILDGMERSLGGMALVQGGALVDLQNGRMPKDYDTNIVTSQHPHIARLRLIGAAKEAGFGVEFYRRSVSLMWKRVKLHTPAGLFDISCVCGPLPLELFACDPDASPCAQAATATRAIATTRHLQGEETQSLIFRPTVHDRDRSRHPQRWFKYAIQKYPERPVHYQSPEDATLFAGFNKRREAIRRFYLNTPVV